MGQVNDYEWIDLALKFQWDRNGWLSRNTGVIMELTDAISYLRNTTDQTHKFWGYYQAVTAAAVAVAWSVDGPKAGLLFWFVLGYVMFSFFNCRLVASSQAEAVIIWNSIQSYKGQLAQTVPTQFSPLLDLNKPDNTRLVVLMHIVISVFAVLAIIAGIVY
ncbi:hypothetical protein ACW9HW_09385 [Pseudomonas sp. SDO5532_S415]|jgi:hypothetical protein